MARCYTCLPGATLTEIKTYLLCQLNNVGGFGQNLIPTGSQYTGTTPTFTLTVLANTAYTIIWGANDLSMTMGGVTYLSPGVGGMTTVYTKGNTSMVFTGTFAGTTVTAIVHVAIAAIPIPSGVSFVLNSAGTSAVSTWDGPPSNVAKTELWTSADGVTYSLSATESVPTVTHSFTAPAIGDILYCKIRWCDSLGNCGGFAAVQQVPETQVAGWAPRVVTNGGAAPSGTSVSALDKFWKLILAAGLDSKLLTVLPMPPDSSVAARTPLLVGTGNALWPQTFVPNLTTDGMASAGAGGQHLNGGVNLLQGFTLASAGITLCVFSSSNAAFHDCGNNNTGFTDGCYLYDRNLANCQGALGSPTTASISVAWPGNGYFSINRIANNDLRLFWGNTGNAHTQQGATVAGVVTTLSTNQDWLLFESWNFQTSTSGSPTTNRISFAAIHRGLTLSESASLFAAVKVLRAALGGGMP